MKVAIIGGAGFIGSKLSELLKINNDFVCILDTETRLNSNSEFIKQIPQIVFPFPDVSNIEKHLVGFDSIVHLSCTSEPAISMDSVLLDAQNNILPSIQIFEAAIKAGVSRIIFSSSGGTVYGTPKTIPVKEEFDKKPISAYGVSKLTIENYLNLYSKNFPIKGISLRIANPYGDYQLRGTRIGIIANYLTHIKNNQEIEVWGNGEIIRDYIHIDSVADAFLKALHSSLLPSGSYNVGSGIGTSINELIDLLFSITNKSVKVNYKLSRPFDVSNISLDSSLFSESTGWKPNVSLHRGIERLWEAI